MPEDTRTMIASPLADLLKSRKAVTALITAGMNLLVVFVPGLEAHRAELLAFSMALWTVLASVLMNSIAKEDSAAKSSPTTVNTGSGDVQVTPAPVTPPTTTTSPENAGDTRPRLITHDEVERGVDEALRDVPPYTGNIPHR